MSFQQAIVITALGKHPNLNFHIADDSIRDGGGPRKRRRLTHLSADEKLLRRKMKNRVAAQTARDRKKAQMEDLEEKLAQLEKETKQLMKENEDLRRKQAMYEKENIYLKLVNSVDSAPSTHAVADPLSLVKQPGSMSLLDMKGMELSAVPCKTETECPGSAVSTVSLPKEQPQDLSSVVMQIASYALTLRSPDTLLHWLEEICSTLGESSPKQERSTADTSTECVGQRGTSDVCGESDACRSLVGSSPADVDSIKEVIHADHLYHKEEPKTESDFFHPIVNSDPQPQSVAGRHVSSTQLPERLDLETAMMLCSEDMMNDLTMNVADASSEVVNARLDFHNQPADIMTVTTSPVAHSFSYSPACPEQVNGSETQNKATTVLSKEMLESLEGLLTLDDFTSMEFSNERQLAVTSSSSDTVSVTQSACHHAQPQQQCDALCNTSSPPVDICKSPIDLYYGKEKECDIDCPSPDSGFSESSECAFSPSSDLSLSPVSLPCVGVDSMVWQDDFVDLQLFPDVGV